MKMSNCNISFFSGIKTQMMVMIPMKFIFGIQVKPIGVWRMVRLLGPKLLKTGCFSIRQVKNKIQVHTQWNFMFYIMKTTLNKLFIKTKCFRTGYKKNIRHMERMGWKWIWRFSQIDNNLIVCILLFTNKAIFK